MKTKIKKSLSIFLTMLMLISIAPTSVITDVFAAGDVIEWSFDGENLVVSGSGELSTTYTSTDEWKNMQDKCVNVLVEGDVTKISDNAFKDFTEIKKVEIKYDDSNKSSRDIVAELKSVFMDKLKIKE